MKFCPFDENMIQNEVCRCSNNGKFLRNRKFFWISSLMVIFLVVFGGCTGGISKGIDVRSSETSQPSSPLVRTSTMIPSTNEAQLEATPTPTKIALSTPTTTMTATIQPTSTVELSTWKQGRLVYTARNEQGAGLYLLDLSTGEVTLLQTEKSENYLLGASSSPDSSKIAYYQYPDLLFVINLLARSSPVSTGNCQSPTWSNDNLSILCRSTGSKFIWSDGHSVPEIRGAIPALAPNGQDLAFAKFENETTKVYLSTVNGSPPILLAGDSSENYAPAWSPSGDKIAYQSNSGSLQSEIWLVDKNGENRRRITFTPDGSWSRAPSWSPDGQWIAFVSNQAGSIGADSGEIFIVSITTDELYQITTTGGKVYDWRVSWMR